MKSKPAFTLIELLVVIAIIGILTTIAVISLNNARAKARDAKRVADIKQVQTALELFFNDQGRYPTTAEFANGSLYSTSTSGTTTYMAAVPTASNPPDGSCTTGQNTFAYTGSDDGSSYTISYCLGGATGSLTTGPKCATPIGVLSVDCSVAGGGGSFTCGDTVAYSGGPYDSNGTTQVTGGYYRTVLIGTQCWFKDNLSIGTRVAGSGNQGDYASGIQKYCYSDLDVNCTTDGGLYQWHMAMAFPQTCDNHDGTSPCVVSSPHQGICPTGWHIPSFIELQTLAQNSDPGCDLAGGTCSTAGGKLKASSTSTPIAWDGTNDYSFSAIPAGYRFPDGSFRYRGDNAVLWSSLPNAGSPGHAWYGYLGSEDSYFYGNGDSRAHGFSVRCLQD